MAIANNEKGKKWTWIIAAIIVIVIVAAAAVAYSSLSGQGQTAPQTQNGTVQNISASVSSGPMQDYNLTGNQSSNTINVG